MQLSGNRGESSAKYALRIDRIGVVHRPGREHFPPVAHASFDFFAPRTIRFSIKSREQCLQRFFAIAFEIHFHGITNPQHPSININLHGASLPLFGQELRIGKARPDHQQRVAIAHHVPTRLRAQQADRARHIRQIVRQRRLAEQCFRDAGAKHVGGLDDFLRRADAPAPTSIATRLPALRTSAARSSSSSVGTIRGECNPCQNGSCHARAAAFRPHPFLARRWAR